MAAGGIFRLLFPHSLPSLSSPLTRSRQTRPEPRRLGSGRVAAWGARLEKIVEFFEQIFHVHPLGRAAHGDGQHGRLQDFFLAGSESGRALGVQGRIKSPTYAVVEPHETAQLAIWHFDFYRFDDPREWEDAGFRDIFASPGLKVAEWPEKAAALTPLADLAIYIEATDETERKVTLLAHTPLGRSLLQGMNA